MDTSASSIAGISVEELGQILAAELSGELSGQLSGVQLVDVREPGELAIAHLPGFQVFSLSEFSTWSDTITHSLDPEKETLVLCHHGVRSAQMCQWLVAQGFSQVKNIVGGIDAYAYAVDPSVPRY